MTPDIMTRSVPLGPDGKPKDTSLRSVVDGAAAAEGSAEAAPDDFRPFSTADVPASGPSNPAADLPIQTPAAAPTRPARKKATAEFLGERAKGRLYTLEHPLAVGGVEYRSTRICSPPGSKFTDYTAYQGQFDPEDIVCWLTCDLPIEVVEVLAFEDKIELVEMGRPFLPRRMRAAMETAEQADTTERTTSSSSSTAAA